jgi:hypothetical protein
VRVDVDELSLVIMCNEHMMKVLKESFQSVKLLFTPIVAVNPSWVHFR